MRKKFLAVALIFAIAAVLCPATLAADSDFTITDGVLTSYTGAGGDVTIPAGVTSIGEQAFSNCTSLTSVTIPNSVTSIEADAFFGCYSLNKVIIPGSVTSFGESAFADCVSLTDVTIQNGVTNIGWNAFANCTSLTDVTIPGSVTSIGNYAFSSCDSLIAFSVAVDNPAYCSIDGVLFNKGQTELLAYPCAKTGAYIIPGSVTRIEKNAFEGCDGLTNVTIPGSVTWIEDYAFHNCTGLTKVTIPGSVTIIGDSSFAGCTDLTDVTIQEGVTSIENNMFSDCASLTSVTIPGSVTSIGNYAFNHCTALTSLTGLTDVTVSGSITSIGRGAFYDCTSLTSITIPGSVTSIEDAAFEGCNGLTSVTIGDGVTSIGSFAFYGCDSLTAFSVAAGNPAYYSVDGVLFNKDQTELLAYPGAKAGAYIIPNSVTSIERYAFYNCTKLTGIEVAGENANYCSVDGVLFNKAITTLIQCPGGKQGSYIIPGSVTSIRDYAFYGCVGLTGITISNGVTSIGDHAFANCVSLTSVTIPGSVTSIGGATFEGCAGLTTFSVASDNPKYCSVDGVLFNKDQTELLAYPDAKAGAYTIPGGVTDIGGSAFNGCTGLTKVTIPNGVTSIGRGAFNCCAGLTSVSIPESVTYIGAEAFTECVGLTDMYYGGTMAQFAKAARYTQIPVGVTIHYNVSLVPAGQAASGTLESANSEALPWTYKADTVTVAEPIPEDEMVLVSCFDESGTFTDVKLLSANQLAASIGQPEHFKLIWLGSSLAPQCEAVEVILTP